MLTEEKGIFFEKNGLFGTLWHEATLFCRYLRLRISERFHSPLWRFIGGQPPLESVVIDAEDQALMLEVAPAEQMPIQAPPPAPRQKIEHDKVADDLMTRFGEKLNARQGRKHDAARRAAIRKAGAGSDPKQMLFEFEDAVIENASTEQENDRRDYADFLDDEEYQLPPISLFDIKEEIKNDNESEIQEVREKIQDCLDSFRIDADVRDAIRGPRVTMFKIYVAMGVKVSTIGTYSKDFARTLAVEALRVLTPVPGHEYAGIEIPNRQSDTVLCGNILNGRAWHQSRALLPLVMGRNIEGQDVILDLGRAPHLLVAGATGSGKSVCLNTFIISLITRFKPSELRLMLVDPKFVEMQAYKTLPHLMVPVINDINLVMIGLRWLVYEMERRLVIMAKVGVRNLQDFNARKLPEEAVLDDFGEPIPAKMPYVVLIVDEMADIMLTAKKDVETLLARLAAKSRAVGIHVIVATQRPSVDIITGTIKANFPTRIAFKTASQIDSRTILDVMGAESLLGRGDMLFKPPTADAMQRIQGAMVDDKEIKAIVEYCALQGTAPTSFDSIKNSETAPESVDANAASASQAEDEPSTDEDSLLLQALEVIMSERRATISYVQRRLKIGYNKSATLIEQLESQGILGPQLNGKREIFPDTLEEAKAMLKKG